MKSLTRLISAAAALLILSAPIGAQAYEWHWRGGDACAWRHRDIGRDRFELHRQWRDIAHDRMRLRREIANGNWPAARAQRADLAQDYMNVHNERRDLYRDYYGVPAPYAGYPVPISQPVPAPF